MKQKPKKKQLVLYPETIIQTASLFALSGDRVIEDKFDKQTRSLFLLFFTYISKLGEYMMIDKEKLDQLYNEAFKETQPDTQANIGNLIKNRINTN